MDRILSKQGIKQCLTHAFIALKVVKHSPVGLMYYICEWLLWKQHSKQRHHQATTFYDDTRKAYIVTTLSCCWNQISQHRRCDIFDSNTWNKLFWPSQRLRNVKNAYDIVFVTMGDKPLTIYNTLVVAFVEWRNKKVKE